MTIVLLVARLLLITVFAVAGASKLADRAGSRQALIDFGLPAVLAIPLGILLPLAELTVAVALIPTATVWWAVLGALGLLLLFVAAISLNLALGRKPDCHCFGQLYSAPVSWKTLARNGFLAVVAGLLLWQGPVGLEINPLGLVLSITPTEALSLALSVILLFIVAVEGRLLLDLMGQNGRLLLRIEALERMLNVSERQPASPPTAQGEGLPVGTRAPAFQLSGLYGETFTLDTLRTAGKPLLLLFSDPGCGPCNALLPEISSWQRDHASKLTIALISRGAIETNRAKASEHGLTYVFLQKDREVAEAYLSHGTPTALMIGTDGTIGSPLAFGADTIRNLVLKAVGMPTPNLAPMALARPRSNGNNGHGPAPTQVMPIAMKIGELSPSFKLPDLSGNSVDLANFRGRETLLLFWNPGCGFCAKMLGDIKAWELNPPKGAPKLLVVSTGTVDANRALEFRSPVVLDEGFSVGRSFGTGGTPSAVLVDAKGNIASEVAVGAPAVLALANVRQNGKYS